MRLSGVAAKAAPLRRLQADHGEKMYCLGPFCQRGHKVVFHLLDLSVLLSAVAAHAGGDAVEGETVFDRCVILPFGKRTTIELTRKLRAAIGELRSIADFKQFAA